MSVLSLRSDRSSYAATAIRDSVQSAMQNVDNYAGIVEFLAYLGNNEDEVLNGIAVGGSGIASGSPSDGRDKIDSLSGNDKGSNADDNDGLVMGLAFGVPLLAIILATVQSARSERKRAFNRILQQSDEEQTKSHRAKKSEDQEDPPGSFHEGMHHYLRDGTRYYSSRCRQCREYNCVFLLDNSFTSSRIGAIPEHEPSVERSEQGHRILPRADLRLGLSQQHMGINVHTCKSATCTRCGPNSPLPIFVPTGVVSRTISYSGSSTTVSSPVSSIHSISARSSAHSSIHSSMQSSVNGKSMFTDAPTRTLTGTAFSPMATITTTMASPNATTFTTAMVSPNAASASEPIEASSP
jgi:hypothetical protein